MDYLQTLERTWQNVLKTWAPPPDLTLSEWADAYAYLSAESSAQPGKWHTIPYQKGIMDAITDPECEYITVMKSARVGYTKIINWAIGYHIHQDPCPIMVVQPTIEDAQGYSKDELAPMLRDVPVLQGLVQDPKSRDSSNTIMKKAYPGGQLLLTGANSARGFRRVSVRKVFNDEVDGYPPSAGQEGDQIKLGTRRTDYFWNRQIVIGSTPTIAGISRVEHYYELSDKRKYFVPCPYCQHMQVLVWRGIDFSNLGTIDNPVYVCEKCGSAIQYEHHRWMIENGEWRATAEFKGHAGFHIWAAYSYSPNATWRQIVKEFLEAKNDREKLKTWVNTILGETFDDQVETIQTHELHEKAENVDTVIPMGAGLLTAQIDTQDDRLEILVKAWGINEESWDIELKIMYGNLATPAFWEELDEFLLSSYRHENGAKMFISCTVIDAMGHFSDEVYRFVKPRQHRHVYAIRGSSQAGVPIVSRPKQVKKAKATKEGVYLIHVGTYAAKELVSRRLAMNPGDAGYIHLNKNFDYEYFEQLTSEKRVPKYHKGVIVGHTYVQTRTRNEAWDLQVYGIAAIRLACPNVADLNRLVEYMQTVQPDVGGNIKPPASRGGRRIISRGVEM